jgi:glycosyltransferase involved in cell wall biosynthesis
MNMPHDTGSGPGPSATVLFVDHAPFIGGAETILLEMAAKLPTSRARPVLVTAEDSPLVARAKRQGLPVATIPFPRLSRFPPVAPVLLFATGRALARQARLHAAALMITNTSRAHVAGLLASVLTGIPLVWALNDDTLPRWLFRLWLNRPTAVVAISHHIARHYSPGPASGRMRIIYPGVELPARQADGGAFRRQIGIPDGAPLAICVGRLVEWKGADVFIAASARVAPEVPAAHFVLVGEPDPSEKDRGGEYRRRLEAQAHAAGLRERLHFAGFRADVGPAYSAADIVVHAARAPEPFGMVLIEAAAYGAAVIATDAGGPREILVHGETGLLVPPGDAASLAGAMRRLFADPSGARAMGEAGRERVAAHFNLAVTVERYLDLFTSVLRRA